MIESNNSVVINAPVENVWLLFTEKKEFDQAKYVPMGTENDSDLTAGQIIHMKIWRFRLTLFIDQFIQAELPATGQTVYGRMAFLGRTGTFVAKSIRDAESHHIQDHFEMRKFWFTTIEDTDIRCIAIDTNSCVVVYQKKI